MASTLMHKVIDHWLIAKSFNSTFLDLTLLVADNLLRMLRLELAYQKLRVLLQCSRNLTKLRY
ncbi:MAG: hypothetical protein ABSG32_26810, partial [Terriglobia bacterium]